MFNLAISQNKKYELRTNLASKRQKRILTILLHQRSFEVCLIIFTVASFLTENSLNRQEIGVFIYTIAWLQFSCYNMRNSFVCIKIWQWFTRNALIKVISILRDLHALRVQRLVINAFIVYLIWTHSKFADSLSLALGKKGEHAWDFMGFFKSDLNCIKYKATLLGFDNAVGKGRTFSSSVNNKCFD